MKENSLLTNATLATLLRGSSQPLFRALNGDLPKLPVHVCCLKFTTFPVPQK